MLVSGQDHPPKKITCAIPSSVSVDRHDDNFTEMCSGSEACSYLRLIDFVYHLTLGLRVVMI